MELNPVSKRGLIILLSPLIFFSVFVSTQLSPTDLNYLKKSLLSLQNEQNGMFGGTTDNTFKAVFSLKVLNEQIPLASKICRDLSFESLNSVSEEMIDLNDLLNCKQTYTLPEELNDEQLMNNTFDSLYRKVSFAYKTKAKVNWELLYENVKPFITEAKLFSNENGGKLPSLLSTAFGLKLLTWIHSHVNQELQTLVEADIIDSIGALQNEFQLIRDDIGLFTEENVSSLKLNSIFADAFTQVDSVVTIENFEEFQLKILNYLVTFKYDYNGLDNIYALLKGLNTLSELPLVSVDKKTFDYVDEKQATLRFSNGFRKEISDYSVVLTYKLKTAEKEKEKLNKNELDLEEEPASEGENALPATATATGTSFINLDLSNLIKNPGKFTLEVKARFSHMTKANKVFDQNFEVTLTAMSKIKLNHLKMTVTNTQDKADEKEITVEYPKRTFKNFKATQNSVIKLKVKFNYGDDKVSNIEQLFLRLRHTELGKSYSAYVTEFRAAEDYYFINFDLSDTSIMEAYDGLYELTLIASDVSLDNPMIWNFGKLDVKFRKPLDPTNLSPSYKNVMKDKMEPFFPEEESPNKNIVSSLLFSLLLLGIFFYYLYYLKSQRANMAYFPKSGANFIFSFLFVVFVLLVTYVLILFFVKLNILQTMLALLILGLPGTFVVYKALSKANIEV